MSAGYAFSNRAGYRLLLSTNILKQAKEYLDGIIMSADEAMVKLSIIACAMHALFMTANSFSLNLIVGEFERWYRFRTFLESDHVTTTNL